MRSRRFVERTEPSDRPGQNGDGASRLHVTPQIVSAVAEFSWCRASPLRLLGDKGSAHRERTLVYWRSDNCHEVRHSDCAGHVCAQCLRGCAHSSLSNSCSCPRSNEKKLNALTLPLLQKLFETLEEAKSRADVAGVVITGRGEYYSAGVDLSSLITPMQPSKLVQKIRDQNQTVFASFLEFPKPIVAAVNGPAIGAAVTSAIPGLSIKSAESSLAGASQPERPLAEGVASW